MRHLLAELQRIANTRGRVSSDHFIVESAHINLRAVRAGRTPTKLVLAASQLQAPSKEVAELLASVGAHCEVTSVPDGELLELSQGRNSGLVVGVFSTHGSGSLDQLTLPKPADFVALVLVDVQEPGNVGALIRTALAGFANLVVCVGISDPFHPKAVRTSMGSLFRLPVVRVSDIEPVLQLTTGYRRFAALADGGKAPWELELGGPSALFVGNEARGLPASACAALENGVTVPMQDNVDSYSVNAATAIVLYELSARRRR